MSWPTVTWQQVKPPSHHFVKSASVHLRGLADSPLNVLEIGVYRAGSAIWLLEQFPLCTYTGIEPRAERAIKALAPYGERARVITGKSHDMLPTLPAESFDVIHVDGDHKPAVALKDGILAWGLLKPGGFMAFDDLHHDGVPVVLPAFEEFRQLHPEAELLEQERQGWLRKAFPVPPTRP